MDPLGVEFFVKCAKCGTGLRAVHCTGICACCAPPHEMHGDVSLHIFRNRLTTRRVLGAFHVLTSVHHDLTVRAAPGMLKRVMGSRSFSGGDAREHAAPSRAWHPVRRASQGLQGIARPQRGCADPWRVAGAVLVPFQYHRDAHVAGCTRCRQQRLGRAQRMRCARCSGARCAAFAAPPALFCRLLQHPGRWDA